MKKVFKKLAASVLAFVYCVSFAACGKKNNDKANEQATEIQSTYGKHDHYFVEETDNYFIKSGQSEYVVVTPSEMPVIGEFAVSELKYFIKLATGAEISVITDEDELPEGQKFISVGKTEMLDEKSFEIDELKYKKSGFQIKSDGDNVYVFSSFLNDRYDGVLCGVYEFLENTIDLRIYAENCFDYVKSGTVKMPDFDIEEIPDFDTRIVMNLRDAHTYAYRMKFIGYNDTPSEMEGHNQVMVLQNSEEYKKHSDWLSADKSVLCYTAYETGMDEEYAKNVIDILLRHPDQNYMFMGVPDVTTPCSCNRCQAAKAKYHTESSGLMIIFLNRVIDKVLDYFAVNAPERYITFGTYAYEGVFAAPSHLDSSGNYVPDDPLTVPHERLTIAFAPVTMDYGYPLDSEKNNSFYNTYLGWNAIASTMDAFEYPYYINARTICHNSINSYVDNLRLYAQGKMNSHLTELHDLGAPFSELKIYVESKLIWNVNLDYNTLAEDFIRHYYGAAAPEIQKYYDFLTAWNASGALPSGYYATKATEFYNSAYLPKSVLDAQKKFIKKGYSLIAGESNAEEYAKEKMRLDKLYFINEANRVEVYFSEMSDSELHSSITALKEIYYSLDYNNCMGAPNGQRSYKEWFELRDPIKG